MVWTTTSGRRAIVLISPMDRSRFTPLFHTFIHTNIHTFQDKQSRSELPGATGEIKADVTRCDDQRALHYTRVPLKHTTTTTHLARLTLPLLSLPPRLRRRLTLLFFALPEDLQWTVMSSPPRRQLLASLQPDMDTAARQRLQRLVARLK